MQLRHKLLFSGQIYFNVQETRLMSNCVILIGTEVETSSKNPGVKGEPGLFLSCLLSLLHSTSEWANITSDP